MAIHRSGMLYLKVLFSVEDISTVPVIVFLRVSFSFFSCGQWAGEDCRGGAPERDGKNGGSSFGRAAASGAYTEHLRTHVPYPLTPHFVSHPLPFS